MRFDVLTLFPAMFQGYLTQSLLNLAIQNGLVRIHLSNIRDFVCNGGEVPAMVLIDTVIRHVPGVLGDETSVNEETHSVRGQVEYPQYTRPRVFRDMEVPEILLSGNHQEIARWRAEQSAK